MSYSPFYVSIESIFFARLQHGVSKAQDKHSAYTYTMAQVLFLSRAIQRIHIYSDIFTSRRTPIFHFTTNNTKAGFMILCWLVSLPVLWMPTAWELIYSSEEDLSHRLSSHRYLTRWMHSALPGCVGGFHTPKVIGFRFIYSLCYRPSWLWLAEDFLWNLFCITFVNHYWEMGMI